MTTVRGLIALVFLLAWAPDVGTQQQPLRIHVFDVGQGDAVLIQSPSGQNVVYDGGDNTTRMRDYLTGLGVFQVGLVIGSHNHADHIGGLGEVLRLFRPQFYMDNGVPATTQTYARLLEAVATAGSQLLEPISRRVLLGDASLVVVPPPGIADWDQNDNSIGIVVEYGNFRLSLGGDAEPRQWAWWMTHHAELLGPVHVHKASHHGSINGDTAAGIAQLSPDIVVVSAGQGNSYEHPDREALRLYAEQGAAVYRTDLHGTIVIEAQASGAYTVRVGAQPPPAPAPAPAPPTPAPTPAPAPTPTPLPPSAPPSSWTGPLPPRSSGSHPVCQGPLPSIAACVNTMTGPPQAVCNDRAFSCSTGSGTCSGHGGVYCWSN